MSRLTTLKLVLLGTGLAVFVYGVYAEDRNVRWFGIAFLAGAFLLRLASRRQEERDEERGSES